jgi:hypothetical protein
MEGVFVRFVYAPPATASRVIRRFGPDALPAFQVTIAASAFIA